MFANILSAQNNDSAIGRSAVPQLSSPLNVSDCSGSVFTYTATSTSPASFTWSRAEVAGISNSANSGVGAVITETLVNTTNNPINVIYQITLTAGSETNTQDVTVEVLPTSPFVGMDDSITTCYGYALGLRVPNPIVGVAYTWYYQGVQVATGESYITPPLTSDAAYTILATGTGCALSPDTKTYSIKVLPIATINVSDATICKGTKVTLIVPSPIAGATYRWYLGSTLVHTGTSYTTPVLTTNTSYTVEISGVRCPSPPITVNVFMYPSWSMGITASADKVCYNSPAILELKNTNSSQTYNVYKDAGLTQLVTSVNGAYASTISVENNIQESTTYYIQAVDSNGCTSDNIVSVYVEVIKFDILPDILPNYRKEKAYSIQLETDADTPAFSLTAGGLPTGLSLYTNGLIEGTVPYTYPNKEDSFTVTVTDINGCQMFKAYTLDKELFIPEIFTPNGDGVNDYFMRGNKVIIFDRLGVQLHEGDNGWDGTYKGKPLPSDTYYYILYDTDSKGKEKRYTGFIMILKR